MMRSDLSRGLLVATLALAAAALLLILFLPSSTEVWVGAGVLIAGAAGCFVAHLRRQVGG
jgi:hypothetical protein